MITLLKTWTDVQTALASNKKTMHYRKGGYSSHGDVDYFSATKVVTHNRARIIVSGPCSTTNTPFIITGWFDQSLSGNVEIVIDRRVGKSLTDAFGILLECLVEQLKRAQSKGGRFPKGAKAFIMRRNSNGGKYRQRVVEAESANLIHVDFRPEYAGMGFGMMKLG